MEAVTSRTFADDVLRFVRQHRSKNYVEIEFRLGRKNTSNFDTNVGPDIHKKALDALNGYREWEKIEIKNEQVYYGSRKGLRIVYNENTEEQHCVIKHNAATLDQVLEGWPLDIRLAASIEIPSSYDSDKDVFPTINNRKRVSFVRKGLTIDVSEIVTTTGEVADLDEESKTRYQIEFEILNVKELDDNKTFNHYNKIFDLLKCLS
jgi:hypothetical protein